MGYPVSKNPEEWGRDEIRVFALQMEEMVDRLSTSELPTWKDLLQWAARKKITELLETQANCPVWEPKGQSEHSRIKGQIEVWQVMLGDNFGIGEAMKRLTRMKQ